MDSIALADSSFKVQNRPFLQASGFRVSIAPNDSAQIRYIISNLGQYPAKILHGGNGLFVDTVISANPFIRPDFKPDTSLLNLYVIKESPTDTITFTTDTTMPFDSFRATINGTLFFYFAGEVYYLNELTKDTNVYRFKVRFYPPDMGTYNILTNDNIELK